MEAKHILIIGGNGFVGSHLADAFLKKGLIVRVVDKGAEKFRAANPTIDQRLGDFGDAAFIASALQGIDTVVHLVSTTVPGTSNDNCVFDIESNLIPTVKLLDAMRTAGCSRIIYFSSGGTVYGNPDKVPTPEDTVLKPICSYGVVKAAIENYIQMYSHLYNINSLIIRPSNLYGNRQGHTGVQGLINTLMERIAHGQEITIWGDGESVRDYIFIDDLVELLCIAIEKEATGIYNAGSGKGHSVNNIIKAIATITGKEAKLNYSPSRSFDVEKIILAPGKAGKDLGWRATTGIEEGILKMWTNRSNS